MPSKRQTTTISLDETHSPLKVQEEPVTFAQLGLQPSLVKSVTSLGYEAPTPIQTRAIPPLLAGRDVMGQAQTGTGKTAAFSLPLLQRIDPKQNAVQALVLTPTRELALQVAEAVHSYAKNQGRLHVLPIYGGASMNQQLDHLRRGVQVVVGTPGRVMDHLKRGSLSLAHAQFLVLDEADEMLKMGFFEDVNWILEQAPKERQIALFSATLPSAIQSLGQRYMKDPVHVRIEQKTATVDTIDQKCIQLTENQKIEALTRLLEVEPIEAVLIFTRTKIGASELAEKLLARGYRAESLHSDLSQSERQKVLRRLQLKQSEIVVATDVAARGLDVQHISHVINYDMPNDGEVYTHRIGRTGRAGKSGISILFVTPRERAMLRQIERFTKKPISIISVPNQKTLLTKRNERFKQSLIDSLKEELKDSLSFVSDFMEEQGEDAMRVAAAAIRLAMTGKSRLSAKAGGAMDAKGGDDFKGDYWPEASSKPKTLGQDEHEIERPRTRERREGTSSKRPERSFRSASSERSFKEGPPERSFRGNVGSFREGSFDKKRRGFEGGTFKKEGSSFSKKERGFDDKKPPKKKFFGKK